METALSAKEWRKGCDTFIGDAKKITYYTKKFDAMKRKNSKISFNLCGLLFSSYWCFYRKMLGWGAIGFLLNFAALYLNIVFGQAALASVIQLVVSLFFGFFGNYCYMRHVERSIAEAAALEGAKREKYYKENAGTSMKILLCMLFVSMVLSLALMASYGTAALGVPTEV